jgi:hypothetical protein
LIPQAKSTHRLRKKPLNRPALGTFQKAPAHPIALRVRRPSRRST